MSKSFFFFVMKTDSKCTFAVQNCGYNIYFSFGILCKSPLSWPRKLGQPWLRVYLTVCCQLSIIIYASFVGMWPRGSRGYCSIHIETQTKLSPFRRRHFQMQFLMKMYEFRLRFHWSLFLRFELTIFQHWFRQWLGADQATSHYLIQWWLHHRCIYASPGLNELRRSYLWDVCAASNVDTTICAMNELGIRIGFSILKLVHRHLNRVDTL